MAGVGGLVSLEEINRSPKQAWALNSNALKHIRDMNEEDGTPTTIKVDLFSDDPFDILTLRKGKGMEYELVPPRKPWSWRGMLNALRDDTKKVIVGEGVTDIWCAPLHGSYDHKRSHAFKKTGKPIPQGPLPIWDFFVRRGDGAVHRFHPSMTNTKVGYNMVDDNDTYPTVPQQRDAAIVTGGGPTGPLSTHHTIRSVTAVGYHHQRKRRASERHRHRQRQPLGGSHRHRQPRWRRSYRHTIGRWRHRLCRWRRWLAQHPPRHRRRPLHCRGSTRRHHRHQWR